MSTPSSPEPAAVALRFFAADGQFLLATHAPAGSRLIDTVRLLGQQGRLNLPWRCAQGTCGTCVVHLQHASSGGTLLMPAMERNVLIRRGLLDTAEKPTGIDEKQTARLACHVRCSADLLVYIKIE
ncbi:hypothetical protein IGB42_00864 [Andreprevotia sp. IGB-42]|uniref:2Fe-2S iron-sulfur cluster-binding protein n=1 Tax=Andreprevotia sp. IGB-42 TaxID=2497473 RepID=UPI001359C092|nr:2Fe-2S iron-sulfur cluster-binding protein [Andreprevotia sp. IGB-42]KAF0814809.1 hypothetical protein IGB42_00864 [Andreprevotia sp. IGB-42]